MTPEFDKWWDDEASIEPHPTNNFREDSAAYWAYEGWVRGTAAEREACAKVCEEMKAAWMEWPYDGACVDCADAIRARGGDA